MIGEKNSPATARTTPTARKPVTAAIGRRAHEEESADEDEPGGHEERRPRGDDGEGQPGRRGSREVEEFLDDRIQAECLAQEFTVWRESAPGDSHRRPQWGSERARQSRERDQQRSGSGGERRDGQGRDGATEDEDQDGQDATRAAAVDEPGPKRCEEARRGAEDGHRDTREGDRTRRLGDRVEQGKQHQRVGGSADECGPEGQRDMGKCEHVEITRCPDGRHEKYSSETGALRRAG
jgi:ribonuclease E